MALIVSPSSTALASAFCITALMGALLFFAWDRMPRPWAACCAWLWVSLEVGVFALTINSFMALAWLDF